VPFLFPDAQFWTETAQKLLNAKADSKPLTGRAKNVIMFLGDGLSVPTLAATRAYIGQSQGKTGEEVVLSFEEFPYTGVSKVSHTCISRQSTRTTVR
jgi:alkaline phosphatase